MMEGADDAHTRRLDHDSQQRDITLPAGDWVYSAFVGNYTGTDTPSTTENRGLYVVVNGKVSANQPLNLTWFDGNTYQR